MKRTKIVATIGPASEKIAVMSAMIKSGLNVARLNFSHNVHAHHQKLIKNLRLAAQKNKANLAILADLQGPRLRLGELPEKGVKLIRNQAVILNCAGQIDLKKKPIKAPVQYPALNRDLKDGDRIFIDNGLILLRVEKISGSDIYCRVIEGGLIKTHKGLNFPDSDIKADPLTAKDLADLDFIVKNDLEYVALSFVRSGQDIVRLRRKILALEKKYRLVSRLALWPTTKIIAKIERQEAIKNFDQILKASDGIMVARGDLGIELPFEKVPLIQKEIIFKCNRVGKPAIVATQMLESMILSPLPTRAEVSDVANAILDGADAIMLSGESATGQHPLLAVKAMKRIADQVEPKEFQIQEELENKLKQLKSVVDFIAYQAQEIAESLKVKIMVCLTASGQTARLVSRYKSKVPLIVLSQKEKVSRQLALVWGAEIGQIEFAKSYEATLKNIIQLLRKEKKVKKGDKILVCAGQTFSYFKKDNFIKIETVE